MWPLTFWTTAAVLQLLETEHRDGGGSNIIGLDSRIETLPTLQSTTPCLGFVSYFDTVAFVAVYARVLQKVLHSVPPGSHPLPGGLPQPGVSRQKDQGTHGDRGSVSLKVERCSTTPSMRQKCSRELISTSRLSVLGWITAIKSFYIVCPLTGSSLRDYSNNLH